MITRLKKILMIFVVFSILVFSMPVSVFAQDGGEPTSGQFTFLQLGQTEIGLLGPHDARTFTFGLPADWKVEGGGELDLMMTVSFNTPLTTDANSPVVVSGGLLTVSFNDEAVGVLSLNQVGEVDQHITIPAEAMASTRADGRMKLQLVLDSGLSCYANQQMTVIIHSGSNFNFPYTEVPPDTALVNFPRPLYQASIVQDSALFVVPDKPSAAELESVLTIAAGLGNLTNNNMLMDLATASELTPEKAAAQNLILVGKASSMPLISQLTLPAGVVSGKFKDSNQDDGVIEMVDSPWNPANVVLLIGGNSDVGVAKAAQAVSTGVLRAGTASNVSIVESVQPNPVNPTLAVYQSLSDLGYDDNQLTTYGTNTATYRFYIPPGASISADAYFDLAYTHSALVDYDRSGIVVNLNNRPIGSARFTDTTAGNSINHLRVSIPPSTIVPGNNLLTISVNLLPLDVCSNPTTRELWAMLWSDSYLNLPLGIFPTSAVSALGLDTYPAPFTFDSTLGSSAFLLQKDNPDAWRSALQVAGFLGNRAGGALTTLKAFYADEVSDTDKANYNLVVVGQPSKLPLMAELNGSLPAPFPDGGDVASQDNLQVTYRVPASSPAGYLEMVPSPWNPDKIVMMILGNSTVGIRWAGSTLVDATLRSRLAGNFAVIDGTQILTGDTRLLTADTGVAATPVVSNAEPQSEPESVNPPAPARPSWILPTLIISIAAVVLILIWLVVGDRRSRRPRTRSKEG